MVSMILTTLCLRIMLLHCLAIKMTYMNQILTVFGRNVTQKVSNQNMLYFRNLPN